MDRYLASLRASSPTYEDPYAYWGGTRPALQYGLPPEQPRPDTTGWTAPLADYGLGGHTPAISPATPPPMPTNLPGGPRPSTPAGSVLGGGFVNQEGGAGPGEAWDLGRFYNAANDRASGYNGENALGRFNRWVGDTLNVARSRGVAVNPDDVREIARGGIKYAAENEANFRDTGFDFTGAQSNTLNPGQAVDFLAAGNRPNQYHTDARGLTVGPGGDPYQRAADHITQTLSGGTTGGATMADTGGGQRPGPLVGGTPSYAPTAGTRGTMPYDQTAAVPGTGALNSTTAGQMLSDPAALQAYIAALGGAPIGDQSFRAQYVRQSLVPMIQASIQTLTGLGGETSADQLGQNIQHYLSMLGGQGGFGQLRGEATKALQNPDLYGNLGLLTDQEAAQRLNQLVGLATAGTGDLYSEAMRQRGLNALSQRHVDQAFLPLGQEAPKYANYFQALPWVQALMGGR